jgi:hypothetical protein
MIDRKFILATCLAAALMPAAFAQTPAKPVAVTQPAAAPSNETVPDGGMPAWIKPETPEHRRERVGTHPDPGMNPDPSVHFWRYGKSFHIEKYERKFAAYDREEGTVRPMALVNFAFEIYQQNEKYVWVWVGDPDPQEALLPAVPAVQTPRFSDSDIKFLGVIRPQYFPLDAPKNNRTIRFEESSDGLPQTGSFRNSMAIADMNEDGFPDLVLPPQRGAGDGLPAIYLGDGKGHWKGWPATVPHALDYGSVVVADFNKDGHMDMAFSVHLTGVYVYLGDGKGHFTEVSEGLPHDFPTRRLVVADVNGDGYPDLVAITEGPTVRPTEGAHGPLIALINKNKGLSWQAENIAPPGVLTGADWLSAGDFNGDGRPDFVLGSIYLGNRDIFYLSKGANQWALLENKVDLIPWGAYFYGNATGKITSKTRDDAIISYIRYWPTDLDPAVLARPPLLEATGIDRVSFAKDGSATRYPVVRWGGHRPVAGLALADVDGDGNLDIVYAQPESHEVVILLGDGKGGFTQANTEGLKLLDLTMYDLKVVDVNGDGRPDIMVMYESGASTNAASSGGLTTPTLGAQSGSVHVFLNRGFSKAEAQAPRSPK